MGNTSFHLTDDDALRYVADQLSNEQLPVIDEHLAECAECREKVQALFYLRENFAEISSWTAGGYAETFRKWQIAEAIKATATASPLLRERISPWLPGLAVGQRVGVKVLIDRHRKIAGVAAGETPEGFGFRLRRTLAGVGSDEVLNRLQTHIENSSKLLGQDKDEEAAAELVNAAGIHARLVQSAESEVTWQGKPFVELSVNSRLRRIFVKHQLASGSPQPLFAVLLADVAQVAGFRQLEGEDAVLAEFEEVADGLYMVEVIFAVANARLYLDLEGNNVPVQESSVARTRADRIAAGWSFKAIGASYLNIEKFNVAVEYFERVVRIGQAENERALESAGLSNLGTAYASLGELRRAIEFFEQDLAITREIGNRAGEGAALRNLGSAYAELGEVRRAIEFIEQDLAIAREIGDVVGEARTSLNYAILLSQEGRRAEALSYAEFASQVYTKAGHVQSARQAQELAAQLRAPEG